MKNLKPEELLSRLEWRRELKNIMGRISHDYAVKQEAEVYSRYWSTRDDVCLGLNNGYYKGKEAVAGYYNALREQIKLSSSLIQKKFPEELGGKTEEEIFGVGMITYLPFESQVIEIADDEKTAKGIWNVRGSSCNFTEAGPVANWLFGWAAVDFIMEDGEWKIWHLLLVFNVDHQCGVGFCEDEKVFEPVPGFEPMADFALPEPNVPGTVFEAYRFDRPRTKSPEAPVPYDSFENTFSYGV